MASQMYIHEENPKLAEEAFYGPFEPCEMQERLNDQFADLLASGLANVNAVTLTDEEAATVYINPRAFWMDQLADLQEFCSA